MSKTNDIRMFFHCRDCIREMPFGISPREWVRQEAGFTEKGVQVWCVRHEKNILHIDFEGTKHPLVSTANVPPGTVHDRKGG